jgi:hypothetical protein
MQLTLSMRRGVLTERSLSSPIVQRKEVMVDVERLESLFPLPAEPAFATKLKAWASALPSASRSSPHMVALSLMNADGPPH